MTPRPSTLVLRTLLLAAALAAQILTQRDSTAFAQCTLPTITTNPANATPANPGISITLSGAASNATSYQWLKNSAAVAGATTTQLTLTNVEQGKDGGSYQLQARNSCGSVNSAVAVVRVRCSSSPGKNTRNIERALTPGQGDYCDWVEDLSPNFPTSNTDTDGSYNRPVVSAAVAFNKEPIRTTGTKTWNMNDWWETYLQGELGLRGTAWYYGGSEFGSFTYSHFNIVSVMAVYYQATNQANQTPQVQNIAALAKRWLRATFALHALSAGPTWPLTKHAYDEITDTGADFQAMGSSNFSGAFVAMAGERSNSAHWNDTHRSILFSKAVAWTPVNTAGENPDVGVARQKLEDLWLPTGNNLNAYGLIASERTALRNIVTTGVLPSNLVSYYLGTALRSKIRYHFVAWQSPFVRVTLMDSNAHTFTAPTTGVAYFTNARNASGREAHFLFPWCCVFTDSPDGAYTTTTGFFDSVNRFIESTNNNAPSPHGARTARISNLPSQTRTYWVTINPDLPPTIH
ncbi:MAG: hypothetical protein QOH21_2903 [Acidobacteriota bacterium]|jgi:hypothetical protein|nr:hypothetical protein [Acidobacteriota bacterium]